MVEREWTTTAVSLAPQVRLPHRAGPTSRPAVRGCYYLLYALNTELKDMTLFRELINKKRWKYRIRFGPGIDAGGSSDAAQTLRRNAFVRHWAAGRGGRPASCLNPPSGKAVRTSAADPPQLARTGTGSSATATLTKSGLPWRLKVTLAWPLPFLQGDPFQAIAACKSLRGLHGLGIA